MFKFICLFASIAYVFADIAPGQNQYLPPDKGYNYDKPNIGFPSGQQPTQVPYPRPPVQRPQPPPSIPQQPRPQQPRPPQPSYGPPPQQPSYRPPAPQPSYGPPQSTAGYPSGPSGHDHHEDHHHHHEPGMPFDFQYSVNDAATANDYTHKAVSDGDVTRGEYRVQLPDGRTQIVRYTADWKNGYNAEVSYEGEARYPDGPFGGNQGGNQGYKY